MKKLIPILLLSTTYFFVNAQTTPAQTKEENKKQYYPKNIFKFNLSSLALHNYNFGYERCLTKKISFTAYYRTMPATVLSNTMLGKQVIKLADKTGDELKNDLSKIEASDNAYTAEFRFYFGKKPGAKGYYLGLYSRYATFKYAYQYFYETQTNTYSLPIKGTAKGLGAGILLGKQFNIGRHVVVDIFMLGGHYGKLTGNAAGAADLSNATEDDKQQIKRDIESINPFKNKQLIKATVDNTGIKAAVNGPFIGIRSFGLSLAIAL